MSTHSTGPSQDERKAGASAVRHAKPLADPITVGIAEAQRLSGLSKSKIYGLINEGRLKSIHIDRRQMVIFQSLKALLTRNSEAERREAESTAA